MKYVNLTFDVVEFRFIKYENRSCYGGRIHLLLSPENFNECAKWCDENNTCGAYLTRSDIIKRRYFQTKVCKNNFYDQPFTDAYIPQGNIAK